MERRSARKSTPRRKYTVDAFEGVEELQDAKPTASEESVESEQNDEDAEDFEVAVDESSEDDGMSGEEATLGAQENASDEASDDGEHLPDQNDFIEDDDGLIVTALAKPKRMRAPHTSVADIFPSQKTYTRGIQEGGMGTNNTSLRRELCYGGASDDVQPAMNARHRWSDEPTLPSRVQRGGKGGMHESYYVDPERLKRRAEDEGREWQRGGGMEGCFKRQRLTEVTEARAKEYMPDPETGRAVFLMGPHADPKRYELPVGGYLKLADAWMDGASMISKPARSRPGSYKNGFMLNLGSRIQCLEWAPNQDGPYQFLAASVLDRDELENVSGETTHRSAFKPQPARRSCIWIWQLKGNEDGSIDVDAGCRRHTTLSSDHGEVNEMRFCPMHVEGTVAELPMLASIWSDGAVRVLQIPMLQPIASANNLHIDKVAFESKPPDTVCTCITWITSTRIAVGCANGSVAIWNIPTSMNSSSPDPRPIIYTSISTSYILSLTTCYPSRPDFLLATSTTGYISLTDLSNSGQTLGSPSTTVFGSRKRIAQRCLAWHDHIQLGIHAEDNYRVVGSPLRRFFVNLTMGRAESNVTALATSPCHPFILTGTASGEVFSANPVKKITDSKPSMWQQTWFAHEWRRRRSENAVSQDGAQHSLGQAHIGAPQPPRTATDDDIGTAGLSKIVEGFKVERNVATKDSGVGYNAHNGILYTTVYEERSAVNTLAWNRNLAFGGWAAAGMGDGLVRVENIAS